MRRFAVLAVSALAAGMLSTGAGAATLDFTGFGFNADLGTQVTLPEATIATSTPNAQIRRLFAVNGFCAVTTLGCSGTATVTFLAPVSNLRFDVFATGVGESTDVKVFGASGLLATLNFATDGIVDLSSYGAITALELTSNLAGTAAGTGFRDFVFDVLPVPEPSALALLGAAAVGAAVRRKRA